MALSYSIISELSTKSKCDSIVAMAVYAGDRLDWLKLSVDSILRQSHQEYCLVIVIDGPVAEEIYQYLRDLEAQNNHLILIHNNENQGLSVCMNLVIDLFVTAKTEYFFRMDADDVALPERLENQIEYFTKHSNVDVLGTALIEINEQGRKVGARKLPVKHHEILRIMPRRCAINHPTVAIRTDVFRAGFRYRSELRNTQDYFLWAELSAAGYHFANLPEALLEFRRVNDFYKRRGLSKSINEFKARFYTMKVLKRHSLGNMVYACSVLILRLMPSKLVKLAYKIDRYLLNKRVRHE